MIDLPFKKVMKHINKTAQRKLKKTSLYHIKHLKTINKQKGASRRYKKSISIEKMTPHYVDKMNER
jgi:hypothetical protein